MCVRMSVIIIYVYVYGGDCTLVHTKCFEKVYITCILIMCTRRTAAQNGVVRTNQIRLCLSGI